VSQESARLYQAAEDEGESLCWRALCASLLRAAPRRPQRPR
jgi:hypothetical protein